MISIQTARDVYRESTIKNGTCEGFFNTHIFRRISICISWFLACLGVSPNVITTVSFTLSTFSGILFLLDFHAFKLEAISLFIIAFVLDMSDGEVARLTHRSSKFGAFYDPFLDRVIDIWLPFCLAAGFYVNSEISSDIMLIMLGLFVTIRSSSFYLEKINSEIGIKEGFLNSLRDMVNTKSNDNIISRIRKYIKWDGGFTIVLYSLCIYFDFIMFLFTFLLLFYGIHLLVNFRLIANLLNEKK